MGDDIIASHLVVFRVRSLSIALLIAIASCALSGQQPKRSREPYIAPVLPAEQAWAVTLPAVPSGAAVMDGQTIYVPLQPESRIADDGEELTRPAALAAIERETGKTRWTQQVATQQSPLLTNGLLLAAEGRDLVAMAPATGERLSGPFVGVVWFAHADGTRVL